MLAITNRFGNMPEKQYYRYILFLLFSFSSFPLFLSLLFLFLILISSVGTREGQTMISSWAQCNSSTLINISPLQISLLNKDSPRYSSSSSYLLLFFYPHLVDLELISSTEKKDRTTKSLCTIRGVTRRINNGATES